MEYSWFEKSEFSTLRMVSIQRLNSMVFITIDRQLCSYFSWVYQHYVKFIHPHIYTRAYHIYAIFINNYSLFFWSELYITLLSIIRTSVSIYLSIYLSMWMRLCILRAYIYIYIYHDVVLPVRISLTLCRHPTLSSITPRRSSGLYPVSA